MDDSLAHLHEQFRHRYAVRKQRLRQHILEGRTPVILRMGDQITLFHRGLRTSENVLSDAYQRWKNLSHVPVAVYLWLADFTSRPLEEETRVALDALAEALRRARDVADVGERSVLDPVLDLLGETIRRDTVNESALRDLGARIEPAIRHLIDRATRDELQALDAIVRRWTSDFGPGEWESLRVLVCANHQARYKETTTLYFRRLLGEAAGVAAEREQHVLYVEGAVTEDEAIDLLAVHHLDRELGTTFLGSARALQRNLLGDAAEAIVEDILPDRALPRRT